MLKYYLLLAWRMMTRQKVYTLINVLGLAIGICACMVIYLVTSYEFSFDKFHPDKERIFRITGEVQRLNGDMEFVNSVVPDVAGIENDIPGFEARAGIWHYGATVKVPGSEGKITSFQGEEVVVTSPDYFRIFSYEWLGGDPATAMKEPHSVVITDERAKLYFGSGAPVKAIGRTLVYNDSLHLKVTGVVKAWTQHSDLDFSDFISLSTAGNPFLKNEIPSQDWSSLRPHGTVAFVKLDRNTTEAKTNALLKDYLNKHAKAAFYGKLVKLQLQPLSELHFTKTYGPADDGDNFRKAHLPTLYILIGIAIFILILAIVNFINLSTALSIKRSKEIGMRKVLGVGRPGLTMQLFTETAVFTILGVVTACLLVNPVLTLFSRYIPQGISFSLGDARLMVFLGAITVLTTLLAGFYPARVLTSLIPVLSLKGISNTGSPSNLGLRKGLIVFQFTVSLVFIIGTFVMNRQISYMRTADKGFKTDAILTVQNWGDEHDKMKLLVQKVKKLPGVDDAVLQRDNPMGFAETSQRLEYKGEREGELEVIMKTGDERFIPFYKMKLVAGRNILGSDSASEMIVNESCARAMGYPNPADAVGKFLYAPDKAIPIVGVVANFHMGSFQTPIRPMVFQHIAEWETSMAVSIQSTNKNIAQTKAIIAGIERSWKEVYPERDFGYNFLDESIGWLFEKEEQAAWLMNAAMIITIFISCMGLFGLSMYTAERRMREIGIRKVLGASVVNIATMLSRDFGMLVLVSTVIATPIGWLIMSRWLEDYTYRAGISWWIFILAMLLALFIAILTVSYQAIKAAIANPVKHLRTE